MFSVNLPRISTVSGMMFLTANSMNGCIQSPSYPISVRIQEFLPLLQKRRIELGKIQSNRFGILGALPLSNRLALLKRLEVAWLFPHSSTEQGDLFSFPHLRLQGQLE